MMPHDPRQADADILMMNCRVRRIRGQRELPRDDLRYVCCGGVAGKKKPGVFLLRERFGNAGQRIAVLLSKTCIFIENTCFA